VPFTTPILLQLNLLQQLIVKNLCPKFHENLTSILVADSRPWTEGCGLHIWHSVLTRKECQKSVLHEYETNFVCITYFGIPMWKIYNFLSSFFSWVCDTFNVFLWLHFPAIPSKIMVGDFAVYIFNYILNCPLLLMSLVWSGRSEKMWHICTVYSTGFIASIQTVQKCRPQDSCSTSIFIYNST
jgi:hypothetical protein